MAVANATEQSEPSRLTNRTGGDLAAGDVVVVDTANASSVALAAGAAAARPLVVLVGGAALAQVRVGSRGIVSVRVTSPAVAIGDQVVASATALHAEVNGSITDGRKIIGVAVSSKAAGAPGYVFVMLTGDPSGLIALTVDGVPLGSARRIDFESIGTMSFTGQFAGEDAVISLNPGGPLVFNLLDYGGAEIGDAALGRAAICIFGLSGADLNDGETIVLPVGESGTAIQTIEVDKGGGVSPGNVAWSVSNGDSGAQLATSFAAVVNAIGATCDYVATIGSQPEWVILRGPTDSPAAISDTITNGGYIDADFHGGAFWNGTDNTSALQDAIDACSAAGRGSVYMPPTRADGTPLRYFFNSTAQWNPINGMHVSLYGERSSIICGGTAKWSFSGDRSALSLSGLEVRGQHQWSEDVAGYFIGIFNSTNTLDTVDVSDCRFAGLMDSAASPGCALLIQGEANVDRLLFDGCRFRRGVVHVHSLRRLTGALSFHDAGFIDGWNAQKSGSERGWAVVGNPSNGTDAGVSNGVLNLRITADENYGGDQSTYFGAITCNPGEATPTGSGLVSGSNRFRSIELRGQVKCGINSPGYAAAVYVKSADYSDIVGLQAQGVLGYDQHIAVFEDAGDVVMRGCRGNVATTGGWKVRFVGSATTSYTEIDCTYGPATFDPGSLLNPPDNTVVVRDGYRMRARVSAGAIAQFQTYVQDPTTDKRVLAATTSTKPHEVAGVAQTAASGAGQTILGVEDDGEPVIVAKDATAVVRAQSLTTSGTDAGMAAPGSDLTGAYAVARESKTGAAGTTLLGVLVRRPPSLTTYLSASASTDEAGGSGSGSAETDIPGGFSWTITQAGTYRVSFSVQITSTGADLFSALGTFRIKVGSTVKVTRKGNVVNANSAGFATVAGEWQGALAVGDVLHITWETSAGDVLHMIDRDASADRMGP